MAASRRTFSNISSIGIAGQARVARSSFAIAGLGGVGGIAFELLLRAGAKEIRIADFGFFEESNANRQLLWSPETDGSEKTAAALALANKINPRCKIVRFGKISWKNAEKFSSGCTAVIDATDSAQSRLAVFKGCQKARIPYIFSSALRFRGMLTVLGGENLKRTPSILSKAAGRQHLQCDHALGPVSNAIGCMAAQQALNISLGKKPILFPRVLSLDAFSSEQFSIHEF